MKYSDDIYFLTKMNSGNFASVFLFTLLLLCNNNTDLQ